jgi:hypothetical protein
MTNAVPLNNATKSSAKAARKDTERAAKARPCPDGAALLAAGDEAYKAGNWADAKAHFQAAAAMHRAAAKTPVAAAAGTPSARAQNRTAASTHASLRLFLSDPSSNLQAKPIRAGVAPECNYARNSPEVLAAFLAKFGPGYRTRFPPEPNGYAAASAAARASGFTCGPPTFRGPAGSVPRQSSTTAALTRSLWYEMRIFDGG